MKFIAHAQLLALSFLSLVICPPHARAAFTQYVWTGSQSSDLSDPANWASGAIPAFGTSINEALWVSGAKNGINYTARQGSTSFTRPDGNMCVVGQTSVGVLNVSGGALNFTASWAKSDDGTTESFWIGNGKNGEGTLNLSGGQINFANSLLIGRDGGLGELNISGGTMEVRNWGVNVGNLGANAARGVINLSGSGQLVIMGATSASGGRGCLSFGSSTERNYINFLPGGTASLSLLASADNFSELVSSGYVRIDGAVATSTGQFTKSSKGTQNVYCLAAVGKSEAVVASTTSNPNEVILLPREASIHGSAARFTRGTPDVIDNWINSNDWIGWKAKISSPGIYNVILEYALDDKAGAVEVAVGDQGARGVLQWTESWGNPCTQFLGQVQIRQAGAVAINLSALEHQGKWVMRFRSIRLVRTNNTKLEEAPQRAIHPAVL